MSSAKRLAQEILDTRRLALGHATSPQLTSSALDGGQLDINDSDGNRIGGLGLGDDGGFVIDYTGGPKPPKPSPPTVTADAGIFRIEWDGSFVNEGDEGVLATSDTDRVEIHASMDENFVPDRVESFGGAFATLDGGSFTLGPLPEAGTYYFRLVARSKSAQFSEPSERIEQTLAITSIDLEITDAWLTGEAAQTTADGKNSIWRGPDEPEPNPDAPFKDGDIWFEMVDGKSIPNIWDETAGAWVANDDKRQSDIERVQQELRDELNSVIIDGGGTANFYQPTPPDATSTPVPKEGDLWFDSSEDGKNMPHIFQDGVWVSAADARVDAIRDAQDALAGEITDVESRAASTAASLASDALTAANNHTDTKVFDSVQIADDAITAPKIKAGAVGAVAIAAQSIEGQHVKAGTITSDKLIVGSSLNLIPGVQAGSNRGLSSLSWDDAEGALMATGRASVLSDEVLRLPAGEYIVTADIRSSAPTTTYVGLFGVDTGFQYRYGISNVPVSSTWSRHEATLTIEDGEEGASRLRILPAYTGDSAATTWYRNLSVRSRADATLIQAGAITTEKIAVGAITAESGIIGSINAGTIVAGEMSGARIKAGTITGDKVLIGSATNLVPGADTISESNLGFSEFTYDQTEQALLGRGSSSIYSDERFTLQPGRYRLEVEAKCTSATGAIGYLGLYHSTGGTHYAISAQRFSTEWATYSGEVEVSEALPFILRIIPDYYNANGPTGSTWFRKLSLRPMAGATLIEGGAISTEHIRAGAITAESGIIGSLDANVITVGKIMGNQLDADAVNGKTITGATIRTASSGSRVELTHNGLKQYNSLGATIVDMTAGSFTLQGGSITGSTIKTANSGSRVEIDTQGLKQYNSKNEVIAEMVGGSMVMRGVLEQTNSVAKMQVGPAWSGGRMSPGVQWTGIAGGKWAGLGIVESGDQVALAMQGPGGTSGGLLDLFEERVYITNQAANSGYLDLYDGGLTMSSTASTGYNQRFYMQDRKIWTGWRNSSNAIGASLYLDDNGIGLYTTGSRRLMLDAENVAIPILPSDSGAVPLGRKSGRLYSVSSARRFKILEEPITDTVDSFEDRLLSVDAKTWIDKTRADRIADYETAIALGEEPEGDLSDCGGLERIPGVVAEDLEAAGLEMFVTYNDDGETESVLYDRIGPALIPIVRSLRDRIESLEAQLSA